MDDFSIIPAKEEDEKEIFRILKIANMHNVPSKEMPYFDYKEYFIAVKSKKIIGVAGFKILPNGIGKTQLMVVNPKYRRLGVGSALQKKRIKEMRKAGVKKIITN